MKTLEEYFAKYDFTRAANDEEIAIFKRALIISHKVASKKNFLYELDVFECEGASAKWIDGQREVALSSKLMQILDDDELTGIIGHEFKHHELMYYKKRYRDLNKSPSDDILMLIGYSFFSLCVFGFTNVFAYFPPVMYGLLQLGKPISENYNNHKIEFLCDKAGAEESSPTHMISALAKITAENIKVNAQCKESWLYRTCRKVGGSMGELHAAVRNTYDPWEKDKSVAETKEEFSFAGALVASTIHNDSRSLTSLFRTHPSYTSRYLRLKLLELKQHSAVRL